MSYRELAVPADLRPLVEAAWTGGGAGQVLPDGCMDLMVLDGEVMVAGPDTAAHQSTSKSARGLRFRPGVLPRLLGVPAAELRNRRVPLADLRPISTPSLVAVTRDLAAEAPRPETSPWELPALSAITCQLATGAAVTAIADEVGWSPRTLQRQCGAVFGYGPSTVRKVLRFRRAVRLLGKGVPAGDVAAECGYSDQPHLYRDVRELAGIPLSQLITGRK